MNEGCVKINHDNIVERRSFDLLEKAISYEASDIHLIPTKDGYDVSFKKDSKLERTGTIPPQLASRMISFFKFLSSLDISDKRRPQSGSFHKQLKEENYSFRVSTIPSIHFKESVVIRLQKHDRIVALDELCFEKVWSDKLRKAISTQQGLIFLTGPTGCGKTTTIYSLTAFCVNDLDRHVITLEDPVENNHTHLLQIQVNEQAGMTYATGLKAILRHSPDVIMIGEIRDSETAKIAIQASLTGHLVLTTVHSKDPEGCFYRMMDFGISIEELRQTTICISTQRLIRDLSGNRKAIFDIIDGKMLNDIAETIRTGNRVVQSHESRMDTISKRYEKSESSIAMEPIHEKQ